jgi:hypothetical protein
LVVLRCLKAIAVGSICTGDNSDHLWIICLKADIASLIKLFKVRILGDWYENQAEVKNSNLNRYFRSV